MDLKPISLAGRGGEWHLPVLLGSPSVTRSWVLGRGSLVSGLPRGPWGQQGAVGRLLYGRNQTSVSVSPAQGPGLGSTGQGIRWF